MLVEDGYFGSQIVRSVNTLAKECYALTKEKGFHKDEVVGNITIDQLSRGISKLHAEVSELWEAGRKEELYEACNKRPDLNNAEEEIADIIIGAFELAQSLGLPSVGGAILKKLEYNASRIYLHKKKC